jgi:uncharacterized repeat protein (TIGR01451 family)
VWEERTVRGETARRGLLLLAAGLVLVTSAWVGAGVHAAGPARQRTQTVQPEVGGAWQHLGPDVVPSSGCNTQPCLAGGRVTALAVDPNNNQLIYAGTVGGVWTSVTGGNSWYPGDNPLTAAFDVSALAVDDQANVYAGTGILTGDTAALGSGIYVSKAPSPVTGYGHTWAHPTGPGGSACANIFSGIAITSIVALSGTATTLIVTTANGTFRSVDSGCTFSKVTDAGHPGETVSWSATEAQDGSGSIYLATTTPVTAVTPSTCTPKTCTPLCTGSVWESTDEGLTWADAGLFFSDTKTQFISNNLTHMPILPEQVPSPMRISLSAPGLGNVFASATNCSGNSAIGPDGRNDEFWQRKVIVNVPPYVWVSHQLAIAGKDGNPELIDPYSTSNSAEGGLGQGAFNNALFAPTGCDVFVGGVFAIHYALCVGGSNLGQGLTQLDGGNIHSDTWAITGDKGGQVAYFGGDGGLYADGSVTQLSAQPVPLVGPGDGQPGTMSAALTYTGVAQNSRSILVGLQDNGVVQGQLGNWNAVEPNDDAGWVGQDANGTAYWSNYTLSQTGGALTPPCPTTNDVLACSQAASRFHPPFVMDTSLPGRVTLLAGGSTADGHLAIYEQQSSGGSWTQSSFGPKGGGAAFSDCVRSADALPEPNLDCVSALAYDPNTQTIVAGSDEGQLYMRGSNGKWLNVNGQGKNTSVPLATSNKQVDVPWITAVALRQTSSGQDEAWVTVADPSGQHGSVYYSSNIANASWTPLTGSGSTTLPNTLFTSILVDREAASTVYVGTAQGVIVCTTCGGGTVSPAWSRLGAGLPGVYVSSITPVLDGSGIAVWTWGRGAWYLRTGLSISNTADAASVLAGSSIGFAVSLLNNGPSTVTGVSIYDQLPTGAGLNWTIDGQTGSACSISGTPPTQTMICSVGTLFANANYGVHISSPTTSSSVGEYLNEATLLIANGPSIAATASVQVTPSAVWTIVSSPNAGPTNTLVRVSCASATFCMTVGTYQSTAGCNCALIEEWNGSAWSNVSPPDIGYTVNLKSVSCTSPSFCIAAGYYQTLGGSTYILIEQWDGSTWSIVNLPNSGTSGDFLGVSCTSGAFCMAVGSVMEKWDGTSWTAITAPPSSPDLYDVSCTDPTFCVAVGFSYTPPNEQTLTMMWDGASWSVVNSPNPSNESRLNGVSCTTASFCIAAGDYYNGSNLTLIEEWNGLNWNLVTSPSPSSLNYIEGVSCANASLCTAVGTEGTPALQTLIEEWDGTGWSISNSANISTLVRNELFGVGCPSTSFCVAVGLDWPSNSDISVQTLIEVS